MKQKKYTKRALCMSILSLLLCCSMLVGTTFAWFTDSVTSGKNRIVAGNLDIELEYATEVPAGGAIEWQPVEATTNLFKVGTLWEPGHTEYVYLRVRNVGSLALKYNLSASVYGDEEGTKAEAEYTNMDGTRTTLSKHLVFRAIDGAVAHTDRSELWLKDADEEAAAKGKVNAINVSGEVLYPKDATGKDSEKIFTLAVYMPTSVGNEANWIGAEKAPGESAPEIYLGLTLNATQTPYEKDSFGDDYDELLTIKGTELASALSSSTAPEVALGEDIHLGDGTFTSSFAIEGDKEIDLNGHTVFGPDTGGGDGLLVEGDNVTIENGKFEQTGSLSCMSIFPGSTVTFDGMSFISHNTETDLGAIVDVTAESDDTGAKTTVVFKDCTFDGAIPEFGGNHSDPLELDVKFINCTFDNVKCEGSWDACLAFESNVWGQVLIDGCTINYDGDNYGAAIRIMGADSEHTLTLTFKDSTLDITKGDHLKVMSNASFVEEGTNTYLVKGESSSCKK